MSVAVLSSTGQRLMPTSNYHARRLLKKGRTVIESYVSRKRDTVTPEEKMGHFLTRMNSCVPTHCIINGGDISSVL